MISRPSACTIMFVRLFLQTGFDRGENWYSRGRYMENEEGKEKGGGGGRNNRYAEVKRG